MLKNLFSAFIASQKKEEPELKFYSLYLEKKNICLLFRSIREIHGGIGQDLAGHCYRLGKYICKDISTFQQEKLEEIERDLLICRDAFGRKTLVKYISLPTFDSGDRTWDSQLAVYLFYDGKQIDLIECHRGYRIGSITIYEGLAAADKELKPWLERLELKTHGIRWLENT